MLMANAYHRLTPLICWEGNLNQLTPNTLATLNPSLDPKIHVDYTHPNELDGEDKKL